MHMMCHGCGTDGHGTVTWPLTEMVASLEYWAASIPSVS